MSKQADEEAAIMIGFLYGIQSNLLSDDEVQHRMEAFRNTKGYKEAIRLVEQRCLEARIDTARHITCLSGEGYFYWQYVGTEGEKEFTPLSEWTRDLQAQLTNLQNKEEK